MYIKKAARFIVILVIIWSVSSLIVYMRQRSESNVTRAHCAKMLAMLGCSAEECRQTQKKFILIDVADTDWFSPYVQNVLSDGMMISNGDLFEPMLNMTFEAAAKAASAFGIEKDMLPFKVTLFNRHRAVNEQTWLALYALMAAKRPEIIRTPVKVLATAATDGNLSNWRIQTDHGELTAEGLNMEKYTGSTVVAFIRDHEIIAVDTYDVSNAVIYSIDDHKTASGTEDSEITAVDDAESTAAQASADETARVSEVPQPDIRVLIMNSDYTSCYHSKVTVSSMSEFVVEADGRQYQYAAGDTVTYQLSDFTEYKGAVRIIPSESSTGLALSSVERSQGTPVYAGALELHADSEGIRIVNVLPIETYLYTVVTSEMPSSYGAEALKAQAVCARSYAAGALVSPAYDIADVCDSTSSQVYQNHAATPEAVSAVRETAGEVMYSQGSIASGKYFSTGYGYLSSYSDVWQKPVSEQDDGRYMQKKAEIFDEVKAAEINDLTDEDNFRAFIDDPAVRTLESDEPWYRWRLILPLSDIEAGFAGKVNRRYAVVPSAFTILSEGDGTVKDDVASVKILERAESGLVKKVRFTGKQQTVTVTGEYNIRYLLSPESVQIKRQDGEYTAGMSILPSGYFYITQTEDEEAACLISGGGFGHGVGMSQNGAKILAEKGQDYKIILSWFFKDITVDSAWNPLSDAADD